MVSELRLQLETLRKKRKAILMKWVNGELNEQKMWNALGKYRIMQDYLMGRLIRLNLGRSITTENEEVNRGIIYEENFGGCKNED